MGKLSGILCVTLTLLILPAWAQAENSFKHLVDIGGGRQLNIVCTGTGSPTAVFIQGAGGDITDWRKVKEPVASFARACFYDRAGFGYSDAPDKPSTAENVADDLHALLRAARIKRPVVLVGHSLGGLFATMYADKFGPDVMGMVLVDPSFAGQFDYTLSEKDREINQSDQFGPLMRTCIKLAEDKNLSANDSHGCFHLPSHLKPQETQYVTQQFFRPSYYASGLSEVENFDPRNGPAIDIKQERRLRRSFGNLPLEVLTAGLNSSNTAISEAGRTAIEVVWKHGHDRLAQRSTRGESIMVPNSHHFIQLDQPDAVVSAIRKVVSEAGQP